MPEFVNIWNCGRAREILLFARINPHFLNQAAKAFVMLGLTDSAGGKKGVEQILLPTK